MKTLNRHWYDIGGVVAVIAIIILAVGWSNMEVLQRMQLLSFIAILIHQFEEYRLPGGEPAITNMIMQPSDKPDRYPLNQFSAMFGNVLIAYIMYLLPVFLPNVIWLGLAPILMGMGQFIVHGLITNIKLKSIYNPGTGAVVFLHIPIGIYYIWYITSNNLATGFDWIVAIIYLVAIMAIVLGFVTYKLLANPNTKYPFTKEEMERFDIERKIERIS